MFVRVFVGRIRVRRWARIGRIRVRSIGGKTEDSGGERREKD